jgi:hypothetical protein
MLYARWSSGSEIKMKKKLISKISLFVFLGLLIFFAGAFSLFLFQKKSLPLTRKSSVLEAIEEVLAKKYIYAADILKVKITQQQGPYVKGTIHFKGETRESYFLAYKNEDNWSLVFDGNGTVVCEMIDDYNFPTTMVSECLTKDNRLIIR